MTIEPKIEITPNNLKEYLNSFEINYETPKDNFIGTFISRTININMLNINGEIPKEFKLKIGLNNETLINQPTFIVDKIELNEETNEVTINGFDYSIKFDKYFDLELTYPCTLLYLANAICKKIGVQLENENFANSNFIMQKAKIDTKYTYREIIGMIAGAMGGIAFINGNDKLEFKKLTNIDFEIENIFETRIENDKIGPINSAVLAREPIIDNVRLKDDESIKNYGKTEIKIVNNYLVDDNRELAITGIYNNLLGKEFYCTNISTYDSFRFNPFDVIKVEGKNVLITNINIKFPNMLDGSIGSQQMSKTEVEYKTAKGLEKRVIDAEAKVDRVEGEIILTTQKVEQVENTANTALNNTITIDNIEKQKDVRIQASEGVLQNVEIYGKSIQNEEPSINNPSPIASVGSNKNLYSKSGKTQGKDNFLARTSTQNGGIGGNGFSVMASNTKCIIYFDELLENEVYTISFTNKLVLHVIFSLKEDGIITYQDDNSLGKNPCTFTQKDKIFMAIIRKPDNANLSDEEIEELKNSIKIEKGNNVTGYTDYNCGGVDYKNIGKNKFDLNKLYKSSGIVKNNSGFNMKNVWAGTVMNNQNFVKDFKTNTSYICTSKVKVISKPTNLDRYNTHAILLLYKPNSGYNPQIIGSSQKNNWNVGEIHEITMEFTTPTDLTGYNLIGYNYHGNDGGSDTALGEFEITDLMIREANIQDDNFEFYKEYNQTIQLSQGIELCSLPNRR